MTRTEYKALTEYLSAIYHRVNKAKEEIAKQNYGNALEILSEAYPKLDVTIQD